MHLQLFGSVLARALKLPLGSALLADLGISEVQSPSLEIIWKHRPHV